MLVLADEVCFGFGDGDFAGTAVTQGLFWSVVQG